MKKITFLLTASCLAFGMLPQAIVHAQGDFSPEMTFELSDYKVGANPELKFHVEQEDGEEELSHVTLRVPKGFSLPADEAIANATEIGAGEIVIAVGPGCRPDAAGAGPTTASPTLPATLQEQDRTDEQSDRGVHAVWLLDVRAVKIVLEITGSPTTGWVIDGDIPPNDHTCPAFSFDLTVVDKAGDVPILVNPLTVKKRGYKFSGTFTSADSPATVTISQKIMITK